MTLSEDRSEPLSTTKGIRQSTRTGSTTAPARTEADRERVFSRTTLAPDRAVYYGGPAPEQRTLVDIFTETAAAYPSAPALDDGTETLTYAELHDRVNTLARKLWSASIGAGDRVGILVPSGTMDLYIAILGVLFSGAAYVPVDADEPSGRADVVWAEGGVCAVIGEGLQLTVRQGVPIHGSGPEPHPEDDAWIIFTSGSTGKPKGVAVTHRSAAALVDAESRLYCVDEPLRPGDRVLAGLSVTFDASCEEMWLAWAHGACLVPAPRSVVRSIIDLGPWLLERKITVVSTVPTLASVWPAEIVSRIRLLIFGGEACPVELGARLSGPGREVWNTYGPTEATVIACAAPLDGTDPVRIGLPLEGWDLAVVDSDGNPVAWGEEGELVIGGVGLARYLDPEISAVKYAPLPSLGWNRAYRSGDKVRAEREGLIFAGRLDEQVKLAGRRVELGEIDHALTALPGVTSAAAAVQVTASGNEILVGYLVESAPGEVDLAGARTELSTRLPATLVPTLRIIDELPMKSSGKVDRNALSVPEKAVEQQLDVEVELNADLRWLAQRWTDLLGPQPLTKDSDFFALGGASLAAAQLVSALRERYPKVSIADIYANPSLLAMAERLRQTTDNGAAKREVPNTPWWTGLVQAPLIAGLYAITGLRYVTGIAIVCWVMSNVLATPWTPNPPLLPLVAAWFVLYSLPARMLGAILACRTLLFRIRPGVYARGGGTHLRLWAAERIVTYGKLEPIMGTPLGLWYARALGCSIGRNVHLEAMPPVTGLAQIDDGAAVEYEVDLAGHWLDGHLLHIGHVRIGAHSRVGARSTVTGDARIGAGSEIEPGTFVSGQVPPGEKWSGSPMEYLGSAGEGWPQNHGAKGPAGMNLLYTAGLSWLTIMTLLAVLPGSMLVLLLLQDARDLGPALFELALWAPVFVVLTMGTYLALTVFSVRMLRSLLPAGMHPLDGPTGWAAWLTNQLLAKNLISMYPLYAGLLTPVWMEWLGAKVGKNVEISTVETLPHLTDVGDRAFLADHSMVSVAKVRQGWLSLGPSQVGEKSFVGNSAIVGGGVSVPDNSLIAVLSSAPADMPEYSSFFGRPPVELPRPVEEGDSSRTYDPPLRLKLARAAVEACRIIPAIITVWLALATVFVLAFISDEAGLWAAVLWSGPVLLASGIAASLVAIAAKWLLLGQFKVSEHPLWSSFVWRNELADVFSESLAVPGLVRMSLGTPMLNAWLRWMGANVGRGVWCETWWLPEFDLIEIGKGASINRGTVLQTHLFHERIMRMDSVWIGAGATLGPNSIVLPGSTIEDGATVGSCSLVMREESVPAHSTWYGNPLTHWDAVAGSAAAPVHRDALTPDADPRRPHGRRRALTESR
ncbi:amino acid adenylation domain-containing protein [Arthrobacter sp. Sa2CUA1]|uniref:Amino acid adenylation domain-containing protein n=1 Tax=Arthrobacter gallicola TaxID=2762225 RepID=A0ABR8UVB9_9MICC|nr:Pls/PosA family non-ribosomal peptide synthetase [Arthrobacter gallicola]MBD7996330.1 amino acid adenylation domain-containing protein [Arthrobacter gallicola]